MRNYLSTLNFKQAERLKISTSSLPLFRLPSPAGAIPRLTTLLLDVVTQFRVFLPSSRSRQLYFSVREVVEFRPSSERVECPTRFRELSHQLSLVKLTPDTVASVKRGVRHIQYYIFWKWIDPEFVNRLQGTYTHS